MIILWGYAPVIAERARKPGRRSVQLLVSSVAGTKAERREKGADRANYGRNPEGFFLHVHLKAGFEACFHHPFFPPFRLSSCVPRKRKPPALPPLPPSDSPQALGLCTGSGKGRAPDVIW